MPRFILTGSYSAKAIKGMVDDPSDREAAGRKIIEAVGGTLDTYVVTTGPNDFVALGSIDSMEALGPAILVAASSGTFSRLETQQAFTSDEFTEMQKKAGGLVSSYPSAT